jgi:hypothetical protein
VSSVSSREYEGPAVDGTDQYLSEAPHWNDDGETVDVVDDDPESEVSAENVPMPPSSPDERRPDVDGQSTWDDWRWSA